MGKEREAGRYYGNDIKNFGKDIKDSQAYISLLNRIQPDGMMPPLNYDGTDGGNDKCAKKVCGMSDRLGVGDYITEQDIKSGNKKVNILYVAKLFEEFPSLDKVDDLELDLDETDEEMAIKNWINSLENTDTFKKKCNIQQITYLYQALQGGTIILKLEDNVKPGIVDWKMVNPESSFSKFGGLMKKQENAKLAVDTAPKVGCKIVGIGGTDIVDGNKNLILAIVWQLMRAYTIKVLKGIISEKEQSKSDKVIIDWANKVLTNNGKENTFKSFTDDSIESSMPIFDLIDCIKSGIVDYSLIEDGMHDSNAKYALGCCRKIGARVYALPQHIVSKNKKMVMTVFACLMGVGLEAGCSVDGDVQLSHHQQNTTHGY